MRVWIEIKSIELIAFNSLSFHPLMRVWIEILGGKSKLTLFKFHPLMRVWIEIYFVGDWQFLNMFHPLMRVWIEIPYTCVVRVQFCCFTLL